METFGDRIKKLRKKMGLSQRQVAEAVGMTQEGISQLERFPLRKPTYENLRNLAKFFKVDPERLLTGKGQQSPIASLTEDESELILLFRAVSTSGQGYILGRARDVYRDEYRDRVDKGDTTGAHPVHKPEKPSH